MIKFYPFPIRCLKDTLWKVATEYIYFNLIC